MARLARMRPGAGRVSIWGSWGSIKLSPRGRSSQHPERNPTGVGRKTQMFFVVTASTAAPRKGRIALRRPGEEPRGGVGVELWYPAAVKNPAATDGGTYESGRPYRGVLHTTESHSFTPSSTDYGGWHMSYPHFTALDRSAGVVIYQHIPIDRAARALANPGGGVQTNRARAIQVEIVGKAAESASMSPRLVQALSEWMRWVEGQTGILREAPLDFRGSDAFGTSSRSRMSAAAWNDFNGWCGHQHVPENSHWDPGRIRIEDLLRASPVAVPKPVPGEPGTRYRVIDVAADDMLNVRAGAGVSHDVAGSVTPWETRLVGSGAEEVVSGATWLEVSFPGGVGWVNSKHVERIQVRPELRDSFGIVGVGANDALNLRRAPGIEHETVCVMPHDAVGIEGTGAVVTVGVSDWNEVTFGEFTGWVNGRFLGDPSERETRTRGGVPDADPYTHGSGDTAST